MDLVRNSRDKPQPGCSVCRTVGYDRRHKERDRHHRIQNDRQAEIQDLIDVEDHGYSADLGQIPHPILPVKDQKQQQDADGRTAAAHHYVGIKKAFAEDRLRGNPGKLSGRDRLQQMTAVEATDPKLVQKERKEKT